MNAPRMLETTPMRPADTNTAPAYPLPPGSCDAHFHVFEPGYPHTARPLYTFPDATLEQYLRLAAQGSCWIKLSGPYRIA
jgi:predicted TIM-barrel fold metal-dependent hydrolase